MNSTAALSNITQQKESPWRIRKVLTVNSDNTVTLDWGLDEDGNPVKKTVPCESGYHTRAPGDQVRVLIDENRGWSVMSKLSSPALIVSQLTITSSS